MHSVIYCRPDHHDIDFRFQGSTFYMFMFVCSISQQSLKMDAQFLVEMQHVAFELIAIWSVDACVFVCVCVSVCIYLYIYIYIYILYILQPSTNEWLICTPHQPMFTGVNEDRARVVRERVN